MVLRKEDALRLIVRGTKGFLAGAVHVLQVGESMVIGRSRAADLSTRKAERLYDRDDWKVILHSEPFLSVSRQHVRIPTAWRSPTWTSGPTPSGWGPRSTSGWRWRRKSPPRRSRDAPVTRRGCPWRRT
jgi:hypothetical protein